MPDTILDDVNALMLKGLGDKRILEQIKRAAENNEVISIYERNYVAKLREQYLEEKPEPEPVPEPEVEKEIPKPITEVVDIPPPPEPEKKKNPQQTKIIAGIGGAALAAILIIGVAMSGFDMSGSSIDNNEDDKPTKSASGISLSTDVTSYSAGDIISISGNSDASLGNLARISIENSGDDLIWAENVNLKSNGDFSTLTIAGGSGWDDNGKYTLIVEHGEKTETLSFSFQG